MSYPIQINCTQISSQLLQCGEHKYTIGDHLDHRDSTQFFIDIGIVGGLVLLAGLMSGLTMGLMSMDTLNLKILINGNDPKSKKHAGRILPLVERHHLLLVTLLLANAACAEALPIFLDRLVHPAIAIVLSVTLVLLFGEIIPQAVCTRFGLSIGSYLSWFVWIMIVILCPIAWPVAKLLDLLLGKETGTFFRRAELKELVHLHAEDEHAPEGENLTIDEVRIIKGAIDMKEKTVAQACTPIDKVYAIDINAALSRDVLQQIVDSGHDRIPVYHVTKDHFIGMILVKDLVLVDPNANVPVRDIKMYRIPMVGSEMHLYDMLHQFQTGKSHMSVVLDSNDHITPQGIITLEDVIEELLQEEIYDEDDVRRHDTPTAEHRTDGYSNVVKDVRLAKAFMPRKYSIVQQMPATMGSPVTRKLSMMVQGSQNPNKDIDLRRRPTVSGTNLSSSTSDITKSTTTTSSSGNNIVGSYPSHVINMPPAPSSRYPPIAPLHHRSRSHPANVVTHLPPNTPNVPHPPPPNNNPPPPPPPSNEQTPLLPPPEGKAGN